MHTTASDGTATPKETIELAKQLGLSAIAITDHDTVSGAVEAVTLGKALGLEVVPGIEISTKFHHAVHILGLYIDPLSDKLAPVLEWVVNDRDQRNRNIVSLMRRDGIRVSYEEMKERFGDVVGRPHFAQILVEQGLAENIDDAFDRYVNKGRKYWLPRSFLSIERSIEIILEAGGIPILAHPFQYKLNDPELRILIEHCIDHGLKGMECRYSGYDDRQVDYLENLAAEYDLFKSGGSDFHGDRKPDIGLGTGKGELNVPYEYLAELKLAAGKA